MSEEKNKKQASIEDLQKKFSSPLTMIDPIDKGRNVAAAVRKEKLFEFIAASREFLKKCDLKFFYPGKIRGMVGGIARRRLWHRPAKL